MSRATKQPAKSIFDHPAVKRVMAWALLYRNVVRTCSVHGDIYPCNSCPQCGNALHVADKPTGDWQSAGRILIAYPDDGAGIVRAYVEIHSGPLAISWRRELIAPPGRGDEMPLSIETHSTQGSAGGYGYDKASVAVADAVRRLGSGPIGNVAVYNALRNLDGRGMSTVRAALETHGYQVVEVL